jgi:hypothetical protein
MIAMIHYGGPVPCKKVAFYVRRRPNPYELAADNVVLVDGSIPRRRDPIMCGSCRLPIVPQWLAEPSKVPA